MRTMFFLIMRVEELNIYSENDTKPDFLDRRGGDGDIYVIKLFSKWFYGCQL